MRAQVKHEIEAFVANQAPGLTVEFIENDAFDSTTISIGVVISNRKMVPRKYGDQQAGALAIEMLAEVQKAAVTAIGMEDYVRMRELAVLDRLAERLQTGDAYTDRVREIEEARQELGESE